MQNQQACWRGLRDELRAAGFAVLDASELTADERQWLDGFFLDQIFPVLTPWRSTRRTRFRSSQSRLLGCARAQGARWRPQPERRCCRCRTSSRFVRLQGAAVRYLPIEALVGLYLDRLFPGFDVVAWAISASYATAKWKFEEEAEIWCDCSNRR